jgi:hypothetical protein
MTEEPTMQEQNNPVRRCRQCRQAGHDVRNCPLYATIHNEALREYQQWIHHCIVDYHLCNKWQYDIHTAGDEGSQQVPTDTHLLQLFIENRDGDNPVETVLKTPTTWIQNQSIENLRILGHVYNFPKTDPYRTLSKDGWIAILHFLLFLQVEQIGTRIYEVKDAVHYLSTSIQCFPVLESIHQYIQTIPNMIPEIVLKPIFKLRPLENRYTRIRELRTNTTRNLRLMQQELNENYREEIGIRRRMNDLRVRRARVENETRRIESGVVRYETEMIMFLKLPADPPKIIFQNPARSMISDTMPKEEMTCSICYEPTPQIDTIQLECKHEFCASCMFLTIAGKFRFVSLELDDCICPFCRGNIGKIYGNVQHMKSVLLEICNKNNIPVDLTRIVGGV